MSKFGSFTHRGRTCKRRKPKPSARYTQAEHREFCIHRGEARTIEKTSGCKSCNAPRVWHCYQLDMDCVPDRARIQEVRTAAPGTQNVTICDGCPHRVKMPLKRIPEYGDVEPVDVTIGIPVAGCIDLLAVAMDLHRLQKNVNVRFILADTLTPADEQEALQKLAESDDVTLLKVTGDWKGVHLSQPVCDAMQAIYDNCETRYLLQTHSDVLPASPWAIDDIMQKCQDGSPVVGYQMSPRQDHAVWKWQRMASHTWTIFDKETIGPLNHSMRDACEATETLDEWQKRINGLPDTECGYNYDMQQRGIKPLLIGPEQNQAFDKTPHFWHVRSLPCSAMYAKGHHEKAQAWKVEAMQQAELWTVEWQG